MHQEKHPRHRKELGAIADEIKSVKNETGCAVFILYSTVSYSEKKSQKREHAVLFAA